LLDKSAERLSIADDVAGDRRAGASAGLTLELNVEMDTASASFWGSVEAFGVSTGAEPEDEESDDDEDGGEGEKEVRDRDDGAATATAEMRNRRSRC